MEYCLIKRAAIYTKEAKFRREKGYKQSLICDEYDPFNQRTVSMEDLHHFLHRELILLRRLCIIFLT